MKSLLENVNELDVVIRQLHKVESKLRSGQFIDGHREILRLIGFFSKAKDDLIRSSVEPGNKQNDQ